jgi:hypothetical protein
MKTRNEQVVEWVNTLPGIRPTDQFFAADRRVFEALVERLLAFADAEAAAMRERAAEVCATYPASRIAADLAAAIRSLPATGEVGRG